MRIYRFLIIIVRGLNPIETDWKMTWKSAWEQAKPKCGCPVNAPEADPDKFCCPCGSHCRTCVQNS